MPALILVLSALVFLLRWHGVLAGFPAGLRALVPVFDQAPLRVLLGLGGTGATLATVAAAAAGGIVAGGRVVRWTGFRERGAAGVVIAAAVGLAAASLGGLGLGLAGLAAAPVAVAGVVLAAAAGVSGIPRLRAAGHIPPGLVLLALVLAVAAAGPETEIDALVYHLSLPQGYVRAHKVFLAPGSFLDGYWQGQEMLVWPALALGSEAAAKLASLAAALLLAAAGGLVARRLAGPSAGWWAAAVLLLAPPMVQAGVHGKNDALAAALVGVALLVRCGPRNSYVRAGGAAGASALLAGGLCGAAAGVRTPAALAFPALLVTWVAVPGGLGAGVLAGFGFVVPLVPWLLRNGLELGNPVFPLGLGTIPTLGMTALDRTLADQYLRLWADANPRGMGESVTAFITVFGGAAPAVAAGLFVAPAALRRAGLTRVLAVFSLVFGAGWAAAFPWLGRFALPAALPLAVLGVARFADDPRRLRVLGWISVAGSIAVLPAFGPASPNPAGCAVGLESRAGFGRRAWGNWWEACEEVNRMVPAGTRAVAVGEWRGRPASRLMARWIADEPVIRELVRGADSVRRLRIRLRQRRVGWLLHNLPQAGFWAGYAARYPWTPDSVARWRTFWDSSATLVWHSPVQDPVHGFFLLYRLSRAPGEAPARGWLPGTEGEFSELRRIVAATAFDPAADRELDRLTVLFGPRADVLARRGDLLAVRGRPVEGLAVCRAAERAAPESREVWSALGALPVAVPADLDRMVRAWRDVVDMGFTLGIPVALSARPIPNPVY